MPAPSVLFFYTRIFHKSGGGGINVNTGVWGVGAEVVTGTDVTDPNEDDVLERALYS